MNKAAIVILGPEIAAYGFPEGHPWGSDRHDVFVDRLDASAAREQIEVMSAREATREELELFHTTTYIDRVRQQSATGTGLLDQGDTPAFPGVYEAAASVVGGTLNALEGIFSGPLTRAFIPIGGLHHARRDGAAGFCVFNDCGVAIAAARERFGVERVAYVDIDAHHGDGVFYAFDDDPSLIFADMHEDGRYLYPGTGARHETGRGDAAGTKLNILLPPGAAEDEFYAAWEEIEAFVAAGRPELILLQCGADSLAGDPITHMQYSEDAHGHAAVRVAALAERYCDGRVLAWGCGGYNRHNLARAWTRVVEGLSGATD